MNENIKLMERERERKGGKDKEREREHFYYLGMFQLTFKEYGIEKIGFGCEGGNTQFRKMLAKSGIDLSSQIPWESPCIPYK